MIDETGGFEEGDLFSGRYDLFVWIEDEFAHCYMLMFKSDGLLRSEKRHLVSFFLFSWRWIPWSFILCLVRWWGLFHLMRGANLWYLIPAEFH